MDNNVGRNTSSAQQQSASESTTPKRSQASNDDWDEPKHHSSHRKVAAPKSKGAGSPLFILILAILIVAFVLPKMSRFSHDVEINIASSSDCNVSFIRFGDENSEVTKLQKQLYAFGLLYFEDISGKYDENTMNALNTFQRDQGIAESVDCSYECYSIVLSSDGLSTVSQSDIEGTEMNDVEIDNENTDILETTAVSTTTTEATTNTTTIKTTTASTTDSENQIEMVRIRRGSTRLRADSDNSSATMFFLDKGDEYKIIEKRTDTSGVQWYKIKYLRDCEGWILAEEAEEFTK